MKNSIFLSLVFFILGLNLNGQSICGGNNQFKILHFTKTNGFDHGTRTVSQSMLEQIGGVENFVVYSTSNESVFNDIDSIKDYAAIIFSNTSGDNLFNSTQRAVIESYYAIGKGFLGIHAATDTYRDGSWPFYNELVGGIVQTNPNHTSANHVDTMDAQIDHPVLFLIPDPWIKQEEYYYWDLNGGMIDTLNFTTALKVRRTGPQNYDRSRPITWFRVFPSGTRSFYTALGHKTNNYTDPNNEFRQLIRNAVCWVSKASNQGTLSNADISLEISKDLLIENKEKGIILKSPDGSCWRITVADDGQVQTTPVECND